MGEGRELLFLLTPKQSIMPPVFTTARSTRRVGAGQFVSEQINALNSELRRLKRDDAASLMIPLTGKPVAFDDCRENDGTMIEVKGLAMRDVARPVFGRRCHSRPMVETSAKPVDAAGSRDVEWFFAEPRRRGKQKNCLGPGKNFRRSKSSSYPPRRRNE